MTERSTNLRWLEALDALQEQINIEDPTLVLKKEVPLNNDFELIPVDGLLQGDGMASAAMSSDPVEAFMHWQCLYIKYIQILRNLEDCYDSMLQPQKREEIKVVLELVMTRIVELKHNLVKWNTPNPDVGPPPFPWEYVNFDELLMDLKLSPKSIEIPIPRYFKEDRKTQIEKRAKIIKIYSNIHLGVDEVKMEDQKIVGNSNKNIESAAGSRRSMTIEEAIRTIQRNERGRLGIKRAENFERYHREAKRRTLASTAKLVVDPEGAASNIQRLFRGYKSRKQVVKEREEELIFIGMKAPKDDGRLTVLETEERESRIRRKNIQQANALELKDSLLELEEIVLEEEGHNMRDKFMEKRTAWVTEYLVQGKGIPQADDMEKHFQELENPKDKSETKAGPPKTMGTKKKGLKKKGVKKTAGKGKKKKKKKKKATVVVKAELPPAIFGPSAITSQMNDNILTFEKDWRGRDVVKSDRRSYELDLAKRTVRPTVEARIRSEVQEIMRLQLQNLKAQWGGAKKKGKKGKKGKKRKGAKKTKRKKKGGKKVKKVRGKDKGKALPGKKLCSDMDVDQMLQTLIENRIIMTPSEAYLSDLCGEFNYLGKVYESNGLRDPRTNHWIFQDPSIAQIRQNITEYAVLPLGSSFLKSKLTSENNVKSILLYGPPGTGKTLLAEAVAHETGAIFFNLSPGNLEGKIEAGAKGYTKLLHMVFEVAKHPQYTPAVIYIDQVERIFVGGTKKRASDDASKFKKDLTTYIKSLGVSDQVVVIGSTNDPYTMIDRHKEVKDTFNKFLYMSWPDYANRVRLWKQFIKRKMNQQIPESIEISLLAQISHGYTAGTIKETVENVLTNRKLVNLRMKPIREKDFVSYLSRCQRTYTQDNIKFREFTEKVTNLSARREAQERLLNGDEPGEKKKKTKKGKKKKGK